MKYFLGVLACVSIILSGCVSKTLTEPMPQHAKIGVMSIMGKAKFELSNATKTASHKTTALKALYRLRPYSHNVANFNFDNAITQAIAKNLQQKGYTHVSKIRIKPNQSPVAAVKAHPHLNYVIVISPDASRAPAFTQSEINSDLVFGYGSYFQDKKGDHHTFGYAGYDISVYNTQNLDILASKYFAQYKEVPYAKWTWDYENLNPSTITKLSHWLKTDVTRNIVKQVSTTLKL